MSTWRTVTRPASLLGFDAFIDEFERLENSRVKSSSFPPYNLFKEGDGYVIELALAGFTKSDVTLTLDRSQKRLIIAGGLDKLQEDRGEALHKGIAARAFSTMFTVADELEVQSAAMENGILTVKLHAVYKDENKPKLIEIS